MSPPLLLAAILGLAVLLGLARLLLWQSRARPEARSQGWRLAALVLLQPICAALFYLTLVPPALPGERRTLVVATRNTPRVAAVTAGERLVALPEAGALPGAERAPDLATVLRRESGTNRLRVLGEGLERRDRYAARGLAIDFDPRAAPRGIVRMSPPERTASGAAFAVGGRVDGMPGGTVELLDPAGRRVDATPTGDFSLQGTARLPGQALFKLRVRDKARKVVEDADVPVWTVAEPPLRVLLVAGAPDPELKYLRRWATDAGVQLQTQASTGGGIALGDTPVPLNAATLRRFDAAILDERSWAALGGAERAALIGAVRDGLGLLLRVTGPVSDAVRRQWQSLGLAVSAASTTATTRLRPHAIDNDALIARRGPGSVDRPAGINPAADEPPVLTYRVAGAPRRDAAPLLPDFAAAVANWHAAGRGRVGLWTLTDSYTLALSGDADRHAELWGSALATLARARATALPAAHSLAWQGERMALCNLPGPSEVVAPGGTRTALLLDGASTCAAFWPSRPGWHFVQRVPAAPGADASPFFVYPRQALQQLRTAEVREATSQLAQTPAQPTRTTAQAVSRRASSWPWFAAWLVASVLLWWFERARLGRRSVSPER